MVMHDGFVISVGGTPVSQDQLIGSLGMIHNEMGRLDGDALCEFHNRLDAEALEQHSRSGRRLSPALMAAWHADLAEKGERQDALGSGSGALPRELEFIRARELQQVMRPLNAYSLFPVDRSVPFGAREHTYRRRVGQGEAVLTRGDTENYGHASSGRVEEKFPVVYILCSVRQNYFEMQSSDFAGVQQYQSDLRYAYRAVDERLNRILFKGDAKTGIFGALNFPGLMKKAMGITLGVSTTAQVLAAIHALVDSPATYSGEAMQSTVLALSPKWFRYLSQTRMETGTDTTLLQFFLAGQDATNGIREVRKISELAGIGPAGEDGMLAFRDEVDSVGIIEVLPTMTMPIWQAGALTWLTLVVAATGGIVMPDVGTNILGLAVAP